MSEEQARDRIGRLIRNLQSLEFLLRAVLLEVKGNEPKVDDKEMLEGAEVPENSFTNFKSLGQLIDEFNENMRILKLGPELSKSSVEIRDMLAHGRVFSREMDGVPTLYKFGRKNDKGMIPIERVVELDNKWLGSAITQTLSDLDLVLNVLATYGKVLQRV